MQQPQELDLPDKIHEELLICKICYCKFSGRGDSLPKLLVCSHTFCVGCITEFFHVNKRRKRDKFPCPVCRKKTVIPKEGIKNLTNNYTILGLIDLLERDENGEAKFHKDHGKRTSKTIHFTGKNVFGNAVDRERAKQSKKFHTAHTHHRSSRQPSGFADLGPKCISPELERRPPPVNPDFCTSRESTIAPSSLLSQQTTSTSVSTSSSSASLHYAANADFSPMTPHQKPEVPNKPPPPVPKRIPGAASIGRKKGRQMVGQMLAMDQPESLGTLPSAPNDPYGELTSLLSETLSTGSNSQQSSPIRTLSPPQPPPRRVSSESVAATPIRCLRKIGKYSESRMQTNAFTEPTRVSVSDLTGDILVVDQLQMNIQVFNGYGEYISMFKVVGVQGACFMSSDKIAAATHRGVELYRPNGLKLKELVVGNSVTAIPYKFGFIVAKPRSLSFFSNGLIQYKDISKVKTGKLRSTSFRCIQDIVVNTIRDLIVLDTGRAEIFVLDSEGNLKFSIDPIQESCGALKQAESITTDQWNNILVSDTGNNRVLKFSANGTYARCLLNFRLTWSSHIQQDSSKLLQTHGLTVTANRDKMVTVITGEKLAYIAIYQLH